MADGDESDELSAVGLCATCTHVRVVRSDCSFEAERLAAATV
jgi:hypothetical protein